MLVTSDSRGHEEEYDWPEDCIEMPYSHTAPGRPWYQRSYDAGWVEEEIGYNVLSDLEE